ncbi:MAG TPA: hypothetical protein PK747_00765 [Acidobacteriota bacterium]|nr:hypothetical protein [Acidobacteriota bacterium]HQO19030.1 hypothetical protein [Acidobacteriota bacterium]HQQ45923.1 hypothetical protein [Acidobacteriota bacterium]
MKIGLKVLMAGLGILLLVNGGVFASTMLPSVPGKAILINPGDAATITISKTPYGQAPTGGDPNTAVEIPANGRVDIADLASSLSGDGYLTIESNGDEPFTLLLDGTKQVPGVRETANGTFACTAVGATNKLYVRADDAVSGQIVVEDRLGAVKSTTNTSFVAGSFSEPSVSVAKGDTVTITFNGNGAAILVSDGEGYPFQAYTQPTLTATAQQVVNSFPPIYSKIVFPFDEISWCQENAGEFMADAFHGSAATYKNATIKTTNSGKLTPLKNSSGKTIGLVDKLPGKNGTLLYKGTIKKDSDAEKNGYNAHVAARMRFAEPDFIGTSETWYAFDTVEAHGMGSTAAKITVNGVNAFAVPGRNQTIHASALAGSADVYKLVSDTPVLVTGRTVGSIGVRDDIVPYDGGDLLFVTGENMPMPTIESYKADGTQLSSVTTGFGMDWTKKSPAELGLAVEAGGSLRLRGNAVLIANGVRAQPVTQGQQGGLEVVVDTPATADPILDQVLTTISVSDTREDAEVAYIRWDGDGDGNFNSTGTDKTWSYSGSDRIPPKNENFTTCYGGGWSGADLTRHLEVTGVYRDKDGNIKNYEYKKEFPISLTDITTMEHEWITDATKSAQVNEIIKQNKDVIAEYWSEGNESCALSKENYLQALDYISNCSDNRIRFNDDVNNVSFSACGNTGQSGCIYEAPYDGVLLMFAPYLQDAE